MTTIFIKRSVLLVLVAAFTAIAVVVTSCGIAAATTMRGQPKVVVVDAGHGGMDGGVVGSSGVKESDLNLLIAKELQRQLENGGVKVVMTRTGEGAIGATKKQDMQNRKKIIVEAQPDLVVSVHINKFSSTKRRGVQVFYDDTGIGKYFAEHLQNTVNQALNSKYTSRSDYVAIKGDLFITKCYSCPSVIVECGFLSNAEDEKLLLTAAYRQEVAEVIAGACLDILGA
ncbi:MAG: N-acetylmuramoyl-L-alanine amidase [Christensenellales bacterium]